MAAPAAAATAGGGGFLSFLGGPGGIALSTLLSSLGGSLFGGTARKRAADTEGIQQQMLIQKLGASKQGLDFLKKILAKGTTINPAMFQKALLANREALAPTIKNILGQGIRNTGVRSPFTYSHAADTAARTEAPFAQNLISQDIGSMQNLQQLFASLSRG